MKKDLKKILLSFVLASSLIGVICVNSGCVTTHRFGKPKKQDVRIDKEDRGGYDAYGFPIKRKEKYDEEIIKRSHKNYFILGIGVLSGILVGYGLRGYLEERKRDKEFCKKM